MKIKKIKLSAIEKYIKQMNIIIKNSHSKILSDSIKKGIAYKKLLQNKSFIERIISYKSILKETEPTSLDETIRHFSQEIYPEIELMYWENISLLFKLKSENNPSLTISQRRLILKDILDQEHKKQLRHTRILSDK